MIYKLRPWKSTDLENLLLYADNWNIAKNLTDKFPHPYTRESGEGFISYASAADPLHIFAIEIEGKACGGIGVHPQEDIFKKNAELGYWLAEPYWGQGIMSAAIKEIVEYAFKTFDTTRIFARPFGTNLGSQKVLEKIGFELEARLKNTIWKKDRFEDELIYAIRKKAGTKQN